MGHTVVPPLEVDLRCADGHDYRRGGGVVEMMLIELALFLLVGATGFWAGYEHGRHVEVDCSLRTVKEIKELMAQTEQRLRKRMEAKSDGYGS